MWFPEQHHRGEKRNIILHYHIFKNAGTTIQFILTRNFGKALASLESEEFNTALGNDVLINFIARHRRVKAITSHQLRPPKPQHQNFLFHDILFLRNPLARFSSMYDFYRRTAATDDPLTREAKQRTTRDFLKLLIDKYPHYVNNVQVSFLASTSRQRAEPALQAAIRVAREATVLGVTELFDIGAVLAEQTLGSVFRRLSFGYVAKNVSSMAPRELATHLSQFQDACGSDVYEQLIKLNSLDLELVRVAGEEVSRRFELIPNRQTLLQQFLLWRSILHPSSVRGVLASNHPHDFVHYANLGTN